ncbi:MAG: LD-carboxypeptidase [Bacteroidales bacterium]|nr:LD-carboxypeptidase [Bacteroidales bacterium]
MRIISPPPLKVGDTVGIVAPARKISLDEVNPAVAMLESWGLKVVLGKNLFNEYHQFAGNDLMRATDFQDMIDSPEIKAILCARGGYGTVRILEHVNFNQLQFNPKWIVGYSDITVLHSYLNMWFNIETIHGTMPINFPKDLVGNESTESLRRVLFGDNPTYFSEPLAINQQGAGVGRLTGGNLSVLCSLSGSDADIYTDGRILVLEDLDEYLYHIDRMMMNLKRSGKLKHLAGLIVGGLSDMRDNLIPFGCNAEAIIHSIVREYDFPVCYGFPVGHQEPNLALIMGRKVSLTVNDKGGRLEFLDSD